MHACALPCCAYAIPQARPPGPARRTSSFLARSACSRALSTLARRSARVCCSSCRWTSSSDVIQSRVDCCVCELATFRSLSSHISLARSRVSAMRFAARSSSLISLLIRFYVVSGV